MWSPAHGSGVRLHLRLDSVAPLRLDWLLTVSTLHAIVAAAILLRLELTVEWIIELAAEGRMGVTILIMLGTMPLCKLVVLIVRRTGLLGFAWSGLCDGVTWLQSRNVLHLCSRLLDVGAGSKWLS